MGFQWNFFNAFMDRKKKSNFVKRNVYDLISSTARKIEIFQQHKNFRSPFNDFKKKMKI